MGTIRILIGVAMFAALAANPAAAQGPLNLLSASKEAKPAATKTVAKKSKTTAATKKPAATAAAKPRVKSAAKKSTGTTARTATRRTPRKAFAQSGRGTVMRGPDTIALIAMLPWWRNDRMQTIEYGSEAANSKVMAATDAWLVQHGTSPGEMTVDNSLTARADDATFDVAIADPKAVNEIDLTAGPSSPTDRSFIQSLIAVLGGAFAAAAAGRFLFV